MGRKTYTPINGWYRLGKGYFVTEMGVLKTARFYVAKTAPEFHVRRKAIIARWESLKAQGKTWWPEVVIQEMVEEGLIQPPETKLSIESAAKLLDLNRNDPLDKDDKSILMNGQGRIKPENAPLAVEMVVRKIVGRVDCRSALAKQLLERWMVDPMGTFEWCSRIFAWTKPEVRNYFQNITNIDYSLRNDKGPQGIAFDASEPVTIEPTEQGTGEDESDDES